MWNLCLAGSVVTLTGRHFDVVELLDTVERCRVGSISIVGDAFAKPILRALDAEPDRWDVSSLRVIVSSGVMWSAETKAGLLRHNPRLIMVDSLGSSEAIGMASTTTTAETGASTARFRPRPEHPGADRGRTRRRARVGRARSGGPSGPDTGRVLQGSGQVGGDVRGDRRCPLLDPRRLGRGRCRRDGPAPRPGQPVHQQRRREDLPGGGRGGAEGPSVGRRRRGRGPPRRPLRRGGDRAGRTSPGRACGRRRPHRPRQDPAGRVQGAQAGPRGGQPRTGRQRQARLPAAQGPGRSEPSAAPGRRPEPDIVV